MVLAKNSFLVCQSYCHNYFTSDAICENCSIKGQRQVNPALTTRNYSLKNNFRCIRRVVLVITVDCEFRNKQCLKQIQQEFNERTINSHLSLLSLLLDVPHVLKTCQARFSDCYFQLNNKRGYFSTFYILRNRADHDVKKNVQSTFKSNDYVLNRDGQNPTGVLAICNSELLTDIATLGSLILSFMVLYLYSIIFVKLLSYRSLFLTKHFVEILTILWTF